MAPSLKSYISKEDQLEGIIQKTYTSGGALYRVITVSKAGRRRDSSDSDVSIVSSIADSQKSAPESDSDKSDASSSDDSSASTAPSSVYSIPVNTNLSSKVRHIPSGFDLMLALGGTLIDSAGDKFTLLDIIDPIGKTVVIFRRHYWCALCSEYCHELAKLPHKRLVAANVKVVLIGCGSFQLIEPHQKKHGLSIESYTNPTLDIYSSLGMYRSLSAGPNSEKGDYITKTMLENVIESTMNGLQMRKNPGKLTQLGGEFVFEYASGEAICSYASRMTNTRNHGKLSDVLRAAGCDLDRFALESDLENIEETSETEVFEITEEAADLTRKGTDLSEDSAEERAVHVDSVNQTD